METKFYACPEPAYRNAEHPMLEEKKIFRTSFEMIRRWYFIGVNEFAWTHLIDEIQKTLVAPYAKSPEPIKQMALGMAVVVTEYLEKRAYDSGIPSRAALMKKQENEKNELLAEARRHFGK